jgi:hypothetical protein
MSKKLDYVFGCRSSTSKFAWDGALVVAKSRDSNIFTIAIFENGMDFTGHLSTYAEALADSRTLNIRLFMVGM